MYIALERHFKSIVNLLKQIVQNTVEFFKDLITKTFFSGEDEKPKPKRKQLSALYNNI